MREKGSPLCRELEITPSVGQREDFKRTVSETISKDQTFTSLEYPEEEKELATENYLKK